MSRIQHLKTFYELLDTLSEKSGGTQLLSQSHGHMNWVQRGVYFFFEQYQTRNSRDALRVVRVGTHAVSTGSKTTLWNRLYTHKGTRSGGGNHRGSIFRLHIGRALIERNGSTEFLHWGHGSNAEKSIRESERPHEEHVSEYIGNMPFLCLGVDDKPGKNSDRAFIERNAITFLAGANGQSPADSPTENWLGVHSPREKIRLSGLWNLNHVGTPDKPESYEPGFLDAFEKHLARDSQS